MQAVPGRRGLRYGTFLLPPHILCTSSCNKRGLGLRIGEVTRQITECVGCSPKASEVNLPISCGHGGAKIQVT